MEEKDKSSARKQPTFVKTGTVGLDEILLGGIKSGNMALIEGGPGTGKTTLGLEFIYRGAVEMNEPGLVVSFELSPQKLQRDSEAFLWDLGALEKRGLVKIIYTSPMVLLNELQSPEGVLAKEIKQLGAKRVLIDGLTPLRLYAEMIGGRPYREALHLLVESLQRHQVTAMLTRELPSHQTIATGDFGHEEFICDTIFTLRKESRRRTIRRSLEVAKSRGQDFITGLHTLRIVDQHGVRIFPRSHARPTIAVEQPTSTERVSFGIAGVDEMLGGGVYKGSVTLQVGISGTGKTISGMHFLYDGAKKGEAGLLVTLDEHPEQLIRNAESLGFDIRPLMDSGLITILYDSPLELEPDVHFHRIRQEVERKNVQRVVLDSLAAYESADPDESRDFVYALATYLKNGLRTSVVNYETPELLGISQISEDLKASTIVDNIILLNYVEVSTRLRRAITVPKARGSRPERETREFTIERGGIALIDGKPEKTGVEPVPQLPFSSYYGILARAPSRRSPLIDESVASGKGMPSSAVFVPHEADEALRNQRKREAKNDGRN